LFLLLLYSLFSMVEHSQVISDLTPTLKEEGFNLVS
jgi:hypothetical protein